MLVKAEGIVIRTHDYGEAHKVVVLFTREQGKIALMARGVKRTKSRLRGVTQLLTHGQYLYYMGSGMGTLNQGETVHSHHSIRQDILLMSYAAYIVELLNKLTGDKEANPFLFGLLDKTLTFLEAGKDADILCRIFEIKLLSVAGYRPELDRCVQCGAADKPFSFSVSLGGVLCLDCGSHDRRLIPISQTSIRLLRTFLHMDLKRLGSIRVKSETKDQLERVMHDYTDHHTELTLKSREFLKKMKELEDIVKRQ